MVTKLIKHESEAGEQRQVVKLFGASDRKAVATRALEFFARERKIPHAAFSRVLACIESAQADSSPVWTMAGLNTQPFFDTMSFEFVQVLRDNCDVIRAEYLAAREAVKNHPRYDLIKTGRWTHLYLYSYGQKMPAAALVPSTAELLGSLSELNGAGSIFFSVLSPGASLYPHRGHFNHRLRCQLGLFVPENCSIHVGLEKRSWVEGECLIFDDTFPHWAMNASHDERVILLCDCWHPDVSEIEKRCIEVIQPFFFNNEARITARLMDYP